MKGFELSRERKTLGTADSSNIELRRICMKVSPFLMLPPVCRTFGLDTGMYWPKYCWHFLSRPLLVNCSRALLIQMGRPLVWHSLGCSLLKNCFSTVLPTCQPVES